MYDNIEKFLRINNYFNFEGPCMNYTGEKNVEQDTNYIISKTNYLNNNSTQDDFISFKKIDGLSRGTIIYILFLVLVRAT